MTDAKSTRPPRPLVYIAAPYAQPDPIRNVRAAMLVWRDLWDMGYAAICPHWTGFQDFLTPLPRDAWLRYDAELLRRCDVVLRLPGDSPGADAECLAAESWNIPVVKSYDELLALMPQHYGD